MSKRRKQIKKKIKKKIKKRIKKKKKGNFYFTKLKTNNK